MRKLLVGFDLFGTLIELPAFDPLYWLLSRHPQMRGRLNELEEILLTAPHEEFVRLAKAESEEYQLARDLGELQRLVAFQVAAGVVYPDVLEVLELLRVRRVCTFLVSNACEGHAHALRSHGLAKYFDDVAFSWRNRKRKPDPRIFQQTLRRLGATEKDRVIFVGDSIEDDVEGARRAGLEAFLLARHGGKVSSNEQTSTTLSDLREIAHLFLA